MKFLILLLFTCALYAAPQGIYFEGGVQYNLDEEVQLTNSTKIKFKQPESYVASLGFQAASQWSFEVESAYTSTKFKDTDTAELQRYDYLVNIYYNAYNETNLVSSIGTGYGKSKIIVDGIKAQDMPVIHHTTVGLGYISSPNVTFNFKYRYLTTNEYTASQTMYNKSKENILSGSLRFIF